MSTEQRHKLVRVGRTRHRCLLCGQLFHDLTYEEALHIEGLCETPHVPPPGLLRFELSDEDIDILVNLPKYARYVTGTKDTAQRKGDDLIKRLEEEWDRDE